jgi:hypothetical protein|tara:strand:+ start:160 stop:378 length:219 start_codon:yes stop_codon:yes gene_type:complete
MFTDNEMRLSLEQEKYLCMLNRLNAFSLIKLEQQKQVQKGLSDVNSDFLTLIECENQLELIDVVLRIRSISN